MYPHRCPPPHRLCDHPYHRTLWWYSSSQSINVIRAYYFSKLYLSSCIPLFISFSFRSMFLTFIHSSYHLRVKNSTLCLRFYHLPVQYPYCMNTVSFGFNYKSTSNYMELPLPDGLSSAKVNIPNHQSRHQRQEARQILSIAYFLHASTVWFRRWKRQLIVETFTNPKPKVCSLVYHLFPLMLLIRQQAAINTIILIAHSTLNRHQPPTLCLHQRLVSRLELLFLKHLSHSYAPSLQLITFIRLSFEMLITLQASY